MKIETRKRQTILLKPSVMARAKREAKRRGMSMYYLIELLLEKQLSVAEKEWDAQQQAFLTLYVKALDDRGHVIGQA
jgi:hypothetical protein